MGFPSSLSSLKRLPCLDGWRCLSILLVLISHSKLTPGYPKSATKWVRWIPDGGFGVEFFFVISGFLITFLLIKEFKNNGTISLKGFYKRRAFRIVPAYAVFLFVILCFQLFLHFNMSWVGWASLLTYTTNYTYGIIPNIVGHIWSLSVEEQFYLVWPIIFLLIIRSKTPKASIWLLLAPVILAPIFRTIGYAIHYKFPFNTYSFLLRCDSLAVGCLLAISLYYWGAIIEEYVFKKFNYLLIAALILIAIPLVTTRLFILGFLTVPFSTLSGSLGIALLILLSLLRPDYLMFRWCHWKPVTFIGVMSYSLYLWQQIFCTGSSALNIENPSFCFIFPYWLVPVFVVAFISYELIEKPFLRLKSRLA